MHLTDFRELTGGGCVDAGLGTVTVKAGSTMMGHTGSVLRARLGRVSAPVGTNAALTQYAGFATFREALCLGDGAGEKGTWTIDGTTTNTTLDVGDLVVGNGSVGSAWAARSVFDHGCAHVRIVNDLLIAQVPGSCGQYICRKVTSNLIGGFAVKCATVGGSGTGLFVHQHGRVVIRGDLVLGRDTGSCGTYVVEEGVTPGEPSCLETHGLIVGERGGATLRILDPDLPIVVKDRIRFGSLASATASDIVAGATLCLRGASIEQKSTNAAALEGLNNI